MEPCTKCGKVHQRDGVATCTGHRKSDGHFCERYPLAGATICTSHGAGAKQVRAAALQRTESAAARQQCDRLGILVEVDPGDALIHAVWEATGNVEFYRALVAELPTHPEPDDLVYGEDGKPHYERGSAGIYGPTYHQSGIPTGEAKPNILVQLYNDERDKLVAYSKAALQANVDERRVRMAESDARLLFGAVTKALARLKLTPEQIEVVRSDLADSFRHPELVGVAR